MSRFSAMEKNGIEIVQDRNVLASKFPRGLALNENT